MAFTDSNPDATQRPALVLTVDGVRRRFLADVTLGRSDECAVVVDHHLASRRHAAATFERGRWWLQDLGSTNGTYLNGAPVEKAPLDGTGTIALGRDAPPIPFEVGLGEDKAVHSERTPNRVAPQKSASSYSGTAPTVRHDPGSSEARVFRSVEEARAYYLDDSRPAGEHTQIIRTIYREAEQGQQRRLLPIVIGALLLCLVAVGVAGWQYYQRERIEAQAEALFASMRQQDLQFAQLMAQVVGTDDRAEGQQALLAQLAEMRTRRDEAAALYDGFVRDLGRYRRLSEREKLIYKTARIFNESHFTIPQAFVDTVNVYIGQWQSSNRFLNGVRRAEAAGYTPHIVQTFQKYGLPPEFFYLALQESDFNPRISGPWTRWGHAKGMWQFIPSTGEKYGLIPGPRQDAKVYDPLDERHDWVEATDAAARYLLDIYSQLSQASGLLAMASYNWGEHRIIGRLDDIAPAQADSLADVRVGFDRAEAALRGIPENIQERSYWKFYGEYADRMPDQTKDYVMHIFSAAVIGQNPRLFGIDLDNPLERYILEAPPPLSDPVAATRPRSND